MSGVLDVAANQDRLAAGFVDQALGLLGILCFIQVGDEYVRTLPRVGQRHRPADTAIATSDDGFPTLQPARHLCRIFRRGPGPGSSSRLSPAWVAAANGMAASDNRVLSGPAMDYSGL